MVNLVIVGCGSIALWRHAPECAKSENINLKGFYDINNQRCAEFAEKFGGKAYSSFDEVLNDNEVDGVIICTANRFHCEMSVSALTHGKHVLCEKPMAVNIKEAKLMIEEAEKAHRMLMIAHSQRYDSMNIALKENLLSKQLGKVISFHTVFAHGGPESWSITKGPGTWFLNKKEAGLGAMGDLGIHKADLIHWLIDDDIKFVTAKVLNLDKKLADGTPIGIDDNAFCIFESQHGIVGTMEASWTRYGKGENVTSLYCENGIIKADETAKNQITINYRDGKVEEIHVEPGNSEMAETFAKCIADNTKPELSGEEGLKALKIVLACIKSSKCGKKVKI